MRNSSLTLVHPEAGREVLLKAAREIPGALVGIKIAALLLTLEAQRPGWVAEVLGVTRQSLNLWIHKVNEHGLASLKPVRRPGRPTRLTTKVRRELEAHLEKSPEEFGINRARWDGPTLVVHLKRQFGIQLKVRQAQMWMHQLGYRMKRAGHTYLLARSEDARKFRRKLKKTSVPESERDDCLRK